MCLQPAAFIFAITSGDFLERAKETFFSVDDPDMRWEVMFLVCVLGPAAAIMYSWDLAEVLT